MVGASPRGRRSPRSGARAGRAETGQGARAKAPRGPGRRGWGNGRGGEGRAGVGPRLAPPPPSARRLTRGHRVGRSHPRSPPAPDMRYSRSAVRPRGEVGRAKPLAVGLARSFLRPRRLLRRRGARKEEREGSGARVGLSLSLSLYVTLALPARSFSRAPPRARRPASRQPRPDSPHLPPPPPAPLGSRQPASAASRLPGDFSRLCRG